MFKKLSIAVSLFLGMISIYWTIELIRDRTDRKITALERQYPFEKDIEVMERFTTDFDYRYHLSYRLQEPGTFKNPDTVQPAFLEFELWNEDKLIEIDEGYGFQAKSGMEYEMKLRFVNANVRPNLLFLVIEPSGPGPSYELLLDREYKWVYWIIIGMLMLITVALGYYGYKS